MPSRRDAIAAGKPMPTSRSFWNAFRGLKGQPLRGPRWLPVSLLIFSFSLVSGVIAQAEKSKAPKDVEEAEQWLRKDFESVGGLDVQFHLDTGEFSYRNKDNQTFGLNLATLVSTALARDAQSGAWRVTYVTYQDGKTYWWQNKDRDRAERFNAALRLMAQQAMHNVDASIATELDKFGLQAQVWRALPEKPKMPEDAYTHKVLAEAAYSEHDLGKAMLEYSLALQKFPTWPEGQFNVASIAGELKRYRSAVMHMKEYLALAPEAPDAQAAKDKIILWQDKTQHP
jgi:tetratricopeptide (TPR) repeat protein